MISKLVLVFCVLVTITATASAQGWSSGNGWGGPGASSNVNPWIPPWVASVPRWVACTTVGSSCVDCATKLVCTKFGGLQRMCNSPSLPYCNLGECSATPAEGCAPGSVSPDKYGA